jgi:nucleoside-diphosphate-sugar epimerase
MSRRLLVAGCGDLGIRLGLDLAAAGWEVLGLRRRTAALPPAIRPIAGDLGSPSSLPSLPRDLDAVAYLASPDGFNDEAYRRAYVDGLRHLLAAIGRPARLVFSSSTAVYPQQDGSWVDESSPTGGEGFSARRLLEGEAVAREAGGVVLRLAGIYGPGRTHLLERVRSGQATCAADRVEWTNRMHADDAAAALRRLLEREEVEPTYVGVDDEPAPRREVLEWLARRLGAPPPRLVPAAQRRGVRPPTSKRCRNALLRATGWRPDYPSWREGYESLLVA